MLKVLIGLLLLTPLANAQTDNPWANPQEDRYEQLLQQADDTYRKWGSLHLTPQLGDRLIKLYARAIALEPDKPEAYLRAATVISQTYLRGTKVPRAKAQLAIAYWRDFEKRSPADPRLADVYVQRALVRTKLATSADWQKAIALYERAIRSTIYLGGQGNTTVVANLAETHMMLGDLDQSIARYRQAVILSADFEHYLGYAVALDRNGQTSKARAVLKPVTNGAAAAMFLRQLQRGDIFYVPSGEKHYYLGLIYEVLGDAEQATRQYQLFLALPHHKEFAKAARRNILELKKR